MKWSELRDGLMRYMLADVVDPTDTEATPNVTNDQLLTYANVAQRVIATSVVGPVATATFTGDGLSTFNLPVDFVSAITIDNGKLVEAGIPLQILRGPATVTSGQAVQKGADLTYLLHWPVTGKISFSRPLNSSESFSMRYRALWPEITLGDAEADPVVEETEMAFDPFHWLTIALVYYVGYLACTAQATSRARLAQWATRPELNVGNPLIEQSEYFYKQYERTVSANRNA